MADGKHNEKETPDHGFGDRGVAGGGKGSEDAGRAPSDLPKGVKPAKGGADWDEKYASENSDKHGQAGGEPIVQRGPAGTTDGEERKKGSTEPHK